MSVRTSTNPLTDLLRVQVLVHQTVDDVRELGAEDEVTGGHQVRGDQLTELFTEWVEPVNNLVLSGVTGDPGVDIGHYVQTDGAEEVIALGGGQAGKTEEAEQEQ